jgi:hypothetical protein
MENSTSDTTTDTITVREGANAVNAIISKISFINRFNLLPELLIILKYELINVYFDQFIYIRSDSFSDLFNLFYRHVMCVSVYYRNKEYHERSNGVRRRPRDLLVGDYDPDFTCLKESINCEVLPEIYPLPSEVSYNLQYDVFKLEWGRYMWNSSPKNTIITSDIKILPIMTKLVAHECKNHCKIYLHQYTEQIISYPITLHDLAVQFMRIMPDKFEFEDIPVDVYIKYLRGQKYLKVEF